MANYYGTARSNYVRLKPSLIPTLEEMFMISIVPNFTGQHAILSDDLNGTPEFFVEDEVDESLLWDLGVENADNVDSMTLLDVIHLCLEPEPHNVFVWHEVGNEKARYLNGFSMAIDHTGKVLKQIDLNDIYKDQLWSRAEY